MAGHTRRLVLCEVTCYCHLPRLSSHNKAALSRDEVHFCKILDTGRAAAKITTNSRQVCDAQPRVARA